MKRFEGKVVIVTDAASGIGEATARRFSSEGASVALVDRNENGFNAGMRTVLPSMLALNAVDQTGKTPRSSAACETRWHARYRFIAHKRCECRCPQTTAFAADF
jgi:NAD(P)-dependent dehydrogenase (short-subunit alcohol dehydrogenase family)